MVLLRVKSGIGNHRPNTPASLRLSQQRSEVRHVRPVTQHFSLLGCGDWPSATASAQLGHQPHFPGRGIDRCAPFSRRFLGFLRLRLLHFAAHAIVMSAPMGAFMRRCCRSSAASGPAPCSVAWSAPPAGLALFIDVAFLQQLAKARLQRVVVSGCCRLILAEASQTSTNNIGPSIAELPASRLPPDMQTTAAV